MYAVHPIPLSEVKAVRKHAPSFGTQHIVMVLTNGLTLPPLYFTAGGVRALFSALKEVWCALSCAVPWLLLREAHRLLELREVPSIGLTFMLPSNEVCYAIALLQRWV